MVDIVTRLGKGSPLTNAEVDANFTNLAEVSGVTGEPMGHEDRTTSTISFNASTRTFTIAPTASSFTVWCKGKKVVVSSARTVTIPNTTGMYSIYFDSTGTLAAKSGYFTFAEEAPTAYIYWNATTGTAPYFGDERHGVVLDWQTHEYLHRTRGAALASGFSASGYVLGGSGSLNSHAQLTLEGGTFFDEDMKIIVTATNTPTAGTWEQDLTSPARIPVLYLSGTAWVIDSPTDYPLKQGTARPQYNAFSGGVWSTADVANNKYATSWILATNNLTYPVIAIIGQAESDLQSAAEAVDFTALQLPGFPSVEFRPLYKLIFQCADSCTNAVHASLVSITDIRSIAAAGTAASIVTDHGNLSGLSDDDHPQYIHVDTLRTVSAAVKASFLPSQTSNDGKFLQTNGTATSWAALSSSNVTTALGFTPYNATNPSGFISGITSGMVTTALGFTPYNATNPSGYVNAAGARGAISVTGAGSYDSATGVINIVGGVTSFNTRTGAITLSSSDVTTALGFTPYNSTNPNGYLTGITSTQVTTALGYTPYNSSNPSGYITGITSGMVTTALGFTPYNNSNPSGYITSAALSPYLTTASAASTYLALSGGTMTGIINMAGTQKITTAGYAGIEYYNTAGNWEGYIGTENNTGNLRYNARLGTHTWYANSTSIGAWDASSLRVSGSVLTTTGASSWGVYSNTNGSNYSGIWFSTNVGELLLRTADGSLSTRIAADGSYAFINYNNILHAGNYTSYSPSLSGSYVNINAGGLFSRYSYNAGTEISDATTAYTLSPNYGTTTVAMHGSHGYLGGYATTLTMSGYERYGATQISAKYNATTAALAIRNYNQDVGGWNSWVGIISTANYSSYALPLSGGTLTGNVTLNTSDGEILVTPTGWRSSDRAAIKIRSKANTPAEIDLRHTVGGVESGWHISARDTSSASELHFYRFNMNSAGAADSAGSFLQMFTFRADGSFHTAGAITQSGSQVLTAGNYSSYALPISGGTLTGTLYFTDTTNGLYKSGGRLNVRSESTDNVAEYASYGLYLPKSGQAAGLYVESPIEARGGLRLGNSAGSGTITVGADTAATANRLVQRDGNGHITGNYILGTYFNSNAGNSENPTIGQVWTQSTGDNYLRKSTPAHFISQLGLLTTSNYSSYALPLSGGTVSGNVSFGGAVNVNSRDIRYFENDSFKEFYVGGDANTYYPVLFGNSAWFHFARWSISRGYGDTAPWDPIGTGAHKGGLTLTWEWSGDGAWGGNDKTIRVIQFSESYTTMVGGMALSVNGFIVWLRGGNAYYRFHGPGGTMNSATPYYSTFTASNGSTFSPRSYDSGTVTAEVTNRMPVRGSHELYDTGNRVLHAGNYSSYALPLSGGTVSGAVRASQITAGGSTNTDANLGVQGTSHLTGTIYYGGSVGNVNSWSSISTSSSGTHTFSGSRFIFDRYGYGSQPLIDLQNGAITLSQQTSITGNLGVLRQRLTFSSTAGDANHSIYNNYNNIDGEGSFDGMKMNVYAGLRIRTGNASGATPTEIVGLSSSAVNISTTTNVYGPAMRQGNNLARPLATWGSSGATGMVIFKLPGSSGNYGMLHMVFDIYEYNSNSVSTVIVGGHNWASSWYNTGANVVGQLAKQVRLGYKDGQYCVVFGDSGSYWEYGTIVFRKIHNGDFYNNIMDLGAAISVQFTATESFSAIGGDLRALRTPASFNAGGAITQAGNQVLHAGNYTGYSPSLGGSGASGTWGISISGSAASLQGYQWASSGKEVRGSQFYCDNWFRNYNSGTGLYNEATGNHFYSDGQYWNVGYSGTTGIRLRNGHAGTILGYLYAETNQNMGLLNSSGNWAVQVYPGGTGGGNLAGTWTGGNLKATRANGNFYIDDNYGCGIVGAYASTRYQGVFAMGDSYKLPADGTSAGNLYGIAWSYPSAGGVAGNLDSHGMLVLINGGFGSCMSYSIKASSNVTAYSDERLKTNWRPMPEDYVARLAQVKVGIYDRIDGEKITQVGVGAQSFQELLPQAIETAKDEIGTLSVAYGNAALASAVELAKDNVELRARIERLESLINKLIGD